MKLGIIQTRGLGDIVIAAPIAMYYIERGYEVYWPIDSEFIPSFKDTFPKIKFIAIDKSLTGNSTAEYFYYSPLEELKKIRCDSIICLYSHLSGFDFGNSRLENSLTFDAYKYAVSGVPFSEKWNFNPKRNFSREKSLFELLKINSSEKFNLVQNAGSNFHVDLTHHIKNQSIRTIRIEPLSENIFDWLGLIERCEAGYFVDSVYSNIIEQMNLNIKKTLFLRSETKFTPVMKSNWSFL
jgi:hypothetical protein